MGNLCYEHEQNDYVHAAPHELLRPKRDRLRSALAGCSRVLEVGMNGGHSALVSLSSNPTLELHAVDICEHRYAYRAAEWLRNEFGDRFIFHEGDCRVVLPRLAAAGHRYDGFHIDGAKFTYFEDVLNASQMISGQSAMIVMDDSNQPAVQRTWSALIRLRVVAHTAEFPPMPSSERYRNQVGHLRALPPWLRAGLSPFDYYLEARRKVPPYLARARRRILPSRS
jgi:predicted O-methyltransferase YrrM